MAETDGRPTTVLWLAAHAWFELRKMVSRGSLSSAGHGVYRVPSLPYDRFDKYILARLWASGRGVISHDSALVVHEIGRAHV